VQEGHLPPLVVEIGEVQNRPRFGLAEALDDLFGESPEVSSVPSLIAK
jgi:hypothetical protein